MYLEWLLIAENFGVNGVFGANLAFLAQIWRKQFDFRCYYSSVRRLGETVVGLLTIIQKPKGGKLLIANPSLAENSKLNKNGVEFTPYRHSWRLYII